MHEAVERVAVVCDDVEVGGGAAALVRASLRQMRRLDLPVTLLAGEALPAAAPGLECLSLGGRHILSGSRLGSGVRSLHDGDVQRALAAWIDENDTPGTVYHLHNWHKVLSPACFGPLRRVASRLICSANDYFLACPNGGYFDFRHHAACDRTPLSAACLAANCDKRNMGHKLWRVARQVARERQIDFRSAGATVLAVHDGMIPLLARRRIPRSAIRVLRNPISPWRTTRIEAERNRSLMFVGRLEVDKGIITLARAANAVGASLAVVGDGPLAGVLPDLCPGVVMHGQRPPAELAAIAGSARLLVLPTLARETFGMVALEAATSGLPVVASTSALITGELVAMDAARACVPDDVEALAGVLSRLLADDAAVESMSRRAFASARTLALTEDEWGGRLLALYAETLARAAAGAQPPAGTVRRATPRTHEEAA